MLLCLHLRIATLQANPTCCHPKLSRLNHILYATNWSLQEIDDAHSRQVYFTTVITLEWQLWYKWKWQLNRLHVSLYSTYVDFYWPGNLYLHQQYTTQQESETNHRAKNYFSCKRVSPVNRDTQWGGYLFSFVKNYKLWIVCCLILNWHCIGWLTRKQPLLHCRSN